MPRPLLLMLELLTIVGSAVLGTGLLYWSVIILDNIWTYNDSGTARYLVFAAVPGVPGLMLLAFALLGLRRLSVLARRRRRLARQRR